MSQTYLSLTVELPEDQSEAVQDLLHGSGAMGLEVRDREAPPMPGVRGPNPGEAIVIAYFEDTGTAEEARAQVAEDFPGARLLLAGACCALVVAVVNGILTLVLPRP